MGWGTSAKRAASPQPVRAAKKDVQRCSICGKPQFNTPSGLTCEEGHGGADAEDEIEIAITPPSKEHHAEMEWAKERARWASDTANMIVTDFVRSKALFGELVKFSRKRRR